MAYANDEDLVVNCFARLIGRFLVFVSLDHKRDIQNVGKHMGGAISF